MTAHPPLTVPAAITELVQRLEQAGFEAWCVGGAVRDALLGAATADFDIATSATPEQVQRLFRRTVPVGLRFGTVGVLDKDGMLHEVTTFRRDVQTDGRHAVVEYGVSLDEDLARRDFTINAMAWHPLRHEWRDPFDGAGDLQRRLVQAVGVAAERFREDYLRILRGLRFAARLDFAWEPATYAAARELAPGLAGLSAERVYDEWSKSLTTVPQLARLVALWHDVGAVAVWMPELRSADEAAALTVPGPGAGRDVVLLTHLLTRDGPAVLRRLKASNAELARATALLRGPAEPDGVADPTVRRWLARVGLAADDLRTAFEMRTGQAPAWAAAMDGIRARGEAVTRGQLAVSGDDLVAAGVRPGPALGAVLDRLLEAVLDDPAKNTREALLALAQETA